MDWEEGKKYEQQDFRKLYEKLYKNLVKSDWFKKAYNNKSLGECPLDFPELAESEDERMRKHIIDIIKDNAKSKCIPCDAEIAYLEKQEVNTEGDFGRGYDCGYQAGYAIAKNEMKPKVATATLDSEKQKEKNNYNKLYKDIAKSEWFKKAYEGKSLGCDYEQKEQKPVENEKVEMTDFEQSVYDLCPVLGIEEAKATASDLLELAKKTLLKTGKVVLASNYPEGCSFEDGFHLGYNEGFNAKKEQKPIELTSMDTIEACMLRYLQSAANRKDDDEIMEDTRKYKQELIGLIWQFSNPPKQEWSEEDEEMLNWCEIVVRGFEIDYCNDDKSHSDWLKDLKNRGNIQKSNTNSPS